MLRRAREAQSLAWIRASHRYSPRITLLQPMFHHTKHLPSPPVGAGACDAAGDDAARLHDGRATATRLAFPGLPTAGWFCKQRLSNADECDEFRVQLLLPSSCAQ